MQMFQKINTFVVGFISEFAKAKHIHYRRIEGDRFYFFTNYSVFDRIHGSKVSVLDDFVSRLRSVVYH